MAQDITIKASYCPGVAGGLTPLTYAGTAEQPDLTVNARPLDVTKTLHMWTIIGSQSTDSSTGLTTYRVYATNYQEKAFVGYENTEQSEARIATKITAFYQTR